MSSCKDAALAAGPRDLAFGEIESRAEKVESREDTNSPTLFSTLYHLLSRRRRSGSRGTRTHKRVAPSPVFETGSSSGRMTSVLFWLLPLFTTTRVILSEFADVHCRAFSSGSWNRTNELLVQSQASLPTATIPESTMNPTDCYETLRHREHEEFAHAVRSVISVPLCFKSFPMNVPT